MSGKHFLAWTDGAARGNPGPSGWGVWIESDNSSSRKLEVAYGDYLCDYGTNNEAEYIAAIEALQWATRERGRIQSFVLHSDSMLVVNQILGKWQVRAPNLQPLQQRARKLVEQAQFQIELVHVRRNLNKNADALANAAIDHEGAVSERQIIKGGRNA